ncbi:MAG: RHS repeat-associated protein [bacterium]|jgi:RHS repeat-associated protein
MKMQKRSWTRPNTGYRFAFNGKEQDPQIVGGGNSYDYGYRIYNPRLGRFLSVDPLTKSYPMLTPYQFASNSPISGVDLDGLEFFYAADGKFLGKVGTSTVVFRVEMEFVQSTVNRINEINQLEKKINYVEMDKGLTFGEALQISFIMYLLELHINTGLTNEELLSRGKDIESIREKLNKTEINRLENRNDEIYKSVLTKEDRIEEIMERRVEIDKEIGEKAKLIGGDQGDGKSGPGVGSLIMIYPLVIEDAKLQVEQKTLNSEIESLQKTKVKNETKIQTLKKS